MSKKRKGLKVDGWINLDKPVGLTSTQALAKVRRYFNAQKGGHAGTLDPLATGVLPIALGEATKTIPFVQDASKTYSFTVTWGEACDTDDLEGRVIATSTNRPALADIRALLPDFMGEIEQRPPQFSAIKIDGERAYDLARDGQDFEIKSRIVRIYDLTITPHPTLPPPGGEDKGGGDAIQETTAFLCTCGKGTYIRAIARDLGERLGCYGHISALRREAVGGFSAQEAISLDLLEKMDQIAALERVLLPLGRVLDDIPALPLSDQEAAKLRNGQSLAFVSKPDFDRLSKAGIDPKSGALVLALHNNIAAALVEIHGPDIRPVRVFNL
jgi:tRNA pseudouridine55 synthase